MQIKEQELKQEYAKFPFEYYAEQRYDYYMKVHPTLQESDLQFLIARDWWLSVNNFEKEGYEKTRRIKQNEIIRKYQRLQNLEHLSNIKFQINYCSSRKIFLNQAKEIQQALFSNFPNNHCDFYSIGGNSEEIALFAITQQSVILIWHSHLDQYDNVDSVLQKIDSILINQK